MSITTKRTKKYWEKQKKRNLRRSKKIKIALSKTSKYSTRF